MHPTLLSATACLFATIPVHAFHARNAVYHHLFLLVTVLSLLFHLTHDPFLKYIDTAVAHTAFLFMLEETCNLGNPRLALFPLVVACLWMLQTGAHRERQDALHAGLHVVSVAGVHAFLLAKQMET